MNQIKILTVNNGVIDDIIYIAKDCTKCQTLSKIFFTMGWLYSGLP